MSFCSILLDGREISMLKISRKCVDPRVLPEISGQHQVCEPIMIGEQALAPTFVGGRRQVALKLYYDIGLIESVNI